MLGAIIIYFVTGRVYLLDTFYINMSLFLAFATIIPDMQMLLFFIIPIKMKWLGYAYGVMLVYDFVSSIFRGNYAVCIAIGLAMINFIFYFFAFMRDRHSPYQYIRRHQFERNMKKGQQQGAAKKWTGVHRQCAFGTCRCQENCTETSLCRLRAYRVG